MKATTLSDQIVSQRGPKNRVDPYRPYAYLVEKEVVRSRLVEQVATLFLTNRECPFRCLMCDLWKNTTDEMVPVGAIPAQIKFALEELGLTGPNQNQAESNPASENTTSQIKLYNSGNFFDVKAVPSEDLPAIACGLNGEFNAGSFENVVVENHPKFCNSRVVEFDRRLDGTLEVAIGLETIHPKVIGRLNKQMTLDDFRRAVEFLVSNGIFVRCFILLRPPFLSEAEGVEWAIKSVEFAYSVGVECCAVIPTRAGNGAMNALMKENQFAEPKLSSLETVMEQGLRVAGSNRRLFVDLWDAERFSQCEQCRSPRILRLQQMNLSQSLMPIVDCQCRTQE